MFLKRNLCKYFKNKLTRTQLLVLYFQLNWKLRGGNWENIPNLIIQQLLEMAYLAKMELKNEKIYFEKENNTFNTNFTIN